MKKILVIEDGEPLRVSLVEILQLEGFAPIAAANGAEGIQMARAQRPDLILCDIAMPELDGFAVLQALQNEPDTAHIPVLFLTARAGKDAVQRGLNEGAAGYITKPFSFPALLATINDHLC
ncbi:MAG: response regulator [Anaerolineae bacterium]|nr:response regulator [Anaerolineae bacterium]